MADFQGKLSLTTTILSSNIVADGGIGWWQIRRVSNVYFLIRSVKTRAY